MSLQKILARLHSAVYIIMAMALWSGFDHTFLAGLYLILGLTGWVLARHESSR
jgi:hypothetical protein